MFPLHVEGLFIRWIILVSGRGGEFYWLLSFWVGTEHGELRPSLPFSEHQDAPSCHQFYRSSLLCAQAEAGWENSTQSSKARKSLLPGAWARFPHRWTLRLIFWSLSAWMLSLSPGSGREKRGFIYQLPQAPICTFNLCPYLMPWEV